MSQTSVTQLHLKSECPLMKDSRLSGNGDVKDVNHNRRCFVILVTLIIQFTVLKFASSQSEARPTGDVRCKGILAQLRLLKIRTMARSCHRSVQKSTFKVSLYSFFWTIQNIFIPPLSKLPGLESI